MAENEIFPEDKLPLEQRHARARKPYRKPRLEMLGDLRTLTLGGSPGRGDSGNYNTQNPPLNSPIRVLNDGSIRLPDGSTKLRNGKIIPPGERP